MLASHWGEMAQLQEGIEEQEQCKTEEEEWGDEVFSASETFVCGVCPQRCSDFLSEATAFFIFNLAQLEYRSVYTSQNRNVETFLDFQTTQTWE